MILKRIKRIYNNQPVACHLYVTDRCNLSCAYCTEYDNKAVDADLATVKSWIDKIAETGCMRIGLQGGEPLLRDDLPEIVAYIRERGMSVSLATNAFLLTEEKAAALKKAGLGAVHVSIDTMEPNEVTKKSLKTVKNKLDIIKKAGIPLHITSVLYGGSVNQLPDLFEYGFENNISVKAHLIHTGTDGEFTTNPGDMEQLVSFIDWELKEKNRGAKIRTTKRVLQYQRNQAAGIKNDWTCLAGYKYFFVSAQGDVWLCSMYRKTICHIDELTPERLWQENRPKPCQDGCGVYCVVAESHVNNHPLKFGLTELWGMVRSLPWRLLFWRKPGRWK